MRRLAVVIAAATLAFGIGAPLAAAGGPPSLTGEWVVLDLSDFDERAGDIVLMRPDGSELTTFTSDTEDTDGELSPDGTAIVFVSTSAEGAQTVWLMDTDGSNRRQLTEGFAGSPTWTPDGRSIVFSTSSTIQIIDRNRGNHRLVAEDLGDFVTRPTVSPDGTTVAFGARVDEQTDIFTVPLAGGDVLRLTEAGGSEPDWSSDGSRILFRSIREGFDGYIWAVDPDGSQEEVLVPMGANDFNASWSPDDSRVMIESVRFDDSAIVVYDRVDGTTETILSTEIDGLSYRRPGWTQVTLDPVQMGAPPETTTTTTTAAAVTTTTTAAPAAQSSSDTNWLVIGLIVAIVGLAGFGVGVVVGGRGAAPPPPPPEDD